MRILCTGCSTKETISLLLWRIIKSFQTRFFFSPGVRESRKKLKPTNTTQDTLDFDRVTGIGWYRVLYESSIITDSYKEHLKFLEKEVLHVAQLWLSSEKLKSTKNNQDALHVENAILNVLQKRKNIAAPFQDKWFSQRHCAWVVAN